MTDEQLDARLRDAGERWRAANVAVAVVHPAGEPGAVHGVVTPILSRRRGRRLTAGGSAAAVLALLVGLAVVLFGDGSDGQLGVARPRSIVGVTWHLAGVGGKLIAPGSDRARDTELMVAGRSLHFGDGCATDTAPLTLDEHSLRVASRTYEEGCGGPRSLALSSTIHRMFDGTVGWSVRDGTLTLSKPGTATLTYRDRSADLTRPAALVDTAWRLIGVGGSSGPYLHAPVRGRLTLDFGAHASIGFDSGVNHTSGSVDIRDATLNLGDLTGTAMGCAGPSPACARAGLVAAVLTGSARWSIAGDQLTITKNGVGSLAYRRTEASTTPTAPASATRTR